MVFLTYIHTYLRACNNNNNKRKSLITQNSSLTSEKQIKSYFEECRPGSHSGMERVCPRSGRQYVFERDMCGESSGKMVKDFCYSTLYFNMANDKQFFFSIGKY